MDLQLRECTGNTKSNLLGRRFPTRSTWAHSTAHHRTAPKQRNNDLQRAMMLTAMMLTTVLESAMMWAFLKSMACQNLSGVEKKEMALVGQLGLQPHPRNSRILPLAHLSPRRSKCLHKLHLECRNCTNPRNSNLAPATFRNTRNTLHHRDRCFLWTNTTEVCNAYKTNHLGFCSASCARR